MTERPRKAGIFPWLQRKQKTMSVLYSTRSI